MAYDNNQQEFSLPGGENDRRRSSDHLPKYFRTPVNTKFLSSTLDQLIQPGSVEKLNGYVGRQHAKGYREGDFYVGDVSTDRKNYQLEPAAVIRDTLDNVNFYGDYNDYINQIRNLDGNVDDHSLLNQQEYYAWNPHIDWDKFVNFREYYWLPNGPQTIQVAGDKVEVESTYTVTVVDNGDNFAYMFTPNGLDQNPELTLYRGVTYRFEVDAIGNPISFRTKRQEAPLWKAKWYYSNGEQVLYNGSVYTSLGVHESGDTFDETLWERDTTFNLESQVSQQSVERGVVEVTLDDETPDLIYYLSDNDIYAGGLIRVKDPVEATFLNLENDVLGKKTYVTNKGWPLSNGMKIKFVGQVYPEIYEQGQWYVEGVGTGIRLISEEELNVPASFTDDLIVKFDTDGFDRLPYSEALGYPVNKDYITINRSSADGNLWSKYNRWFHRDVIELSETLNGSELELDQSARATRPIIEFESGLKIFNFGTKVKPNVDLVDTFTKDVFSTIEGSEGYNIDGVDLTNGMRVLFIADPDILVNGKIYEVKFIIHNNTRQITLVETDDTTPLENETVLCKQGDTYKGKMFWYNGTEWKLSQDKTTINQPPLFDVFDCEGNSFGNLTVYESSTFTGTKVFSYKQGSGLNDPELGFPLSYRSIENVGDIVFYFDLLSDSMTYCPTNSTPLEQITGLGFVRRYQSRTQYQTENGWKKAHTLSTQPVIRQYVNDNTRTFYPIDVYDNSGLLDDLWIRVYVNNSLMFENQDYTLTVDNTNRRIVTFTQTLEENAVIIIKTRSAAPKNDNGLYEIPSNLERNPLNEDITEFTLGEVNDHVGTIIEEIDTFYGAYPGVGNLRDLGLVSKYGKRIVKHSAPMNLSLYHMIDKDANIVKSLKYARREYGKFKRLFLQKAKDIGFTGDIKQHVDIILKEIVKDKTKTMPFYFSDMVPFGASVYNEIEIEEPEIEFFALTTPFTLNEVNDKAVSIYLNGIQLLSGRDYTFNDQGFVSITATKAVGDIIEIYEYETTNGSYVPPTPTKLGLYPKFEPSKYTDTTYLEPQEVIQGHDGSISIAFGDYRDDLLIELEYRIFNNIKMPYDDQLFNIYDFLPGADRNTGLSRAQIDHSMLSDFVNWVQLTEEDYTDHTFFDRENSFTFNYRGMSGINNTETVGFWRGIYKYAYDTDRPHTHPWEMLGFSIKPSWWEEQYGEAPYTSNNLLMWEDIEAGRIHQPGSLPVTNKKFIRRGLTSYLPVDEDGNLVSPLLSSYISIYKTTNIDSNFIYGDHSPVENAWRRSSEYPFALITSMLLNQPSRVLATAFDRIRQKRGLAGDIIYSSPNRQIRLTDIQFPNKVDADTRTYTLGLVNYIYDYLASNVTTTYESYIDNVRAINNQLGFKVGGYTSKDKFKLVLDSRTPLNKGNVFIPQENYKVVLNKSTPIKNVYYSGVMVEKQPDGFIIRGYSAEQPYFKYNKPIPTAGDPVVNIGGVSANFLYWDSNKNYSKGSIVEFQGSYYRVTEAHTSGSDFDNSKYAKLPQLPLQGGREATFSKRFSKKETVIFYGQILETIQEVVDFLLGYGNWLETQGFRFDFYSAQDEFVAEWKTSAKEFLFWTTQNWASGAVISLSPSAIGLKFKSEYATIDNIYDTFYGYSLLKADGKKLNPQNVSLTREEPTEFIIKPKNTEDGIFAVRLSLVQKEHVVLIDNRTVFGDVIYDQEPGYRQERIRVLGYRTGDWDGSINVPGFIFDNAKITEWESWQDYALGDLIKYKEFYYTAKNKIPGTETFNPKDWARLDEKPETGLIPNFEYKTNQFADFYDLDTDNFDIEQQKFAQHLIGYQNRDYLANIINDDVSQYKFYQGMIQDKGTRNVLDKLFDVLSSADKESLDFYEEWAIKVGQYGAAAGFEEVEYLIDESKMRLEPQSFELVTTVTGEETDLVYRILPYEAYLKSKGYTHAPFPTKEVNTTYTKNSGYVNPDDVDFIVSTYDSMLNIDFFECTFGSTVWVGNDGLEWNVYTHVRTEIEVEEIGTIDNGAIITIPTTKQPFEKDEIIGLYNVTGLPAGFYKISKVYNNKIEIITDATVEDATGLDGRITRLIDSRVSNVTEANNLLQTINEGLNKLWIDDVTDGNWNVVENANAFNQHQVITNLDKGDKHQYATAMTASKNNTILAVGSPTNGDGKVFIYTRAGNNGSYQLVQEIEPDDVLAKRYSSWYVPVLPGATTYNVNDIIVYNGSFYKCTYMFTASKTYEESLSSAWSRYSDNFIEIETPADTQHFGSSVAVSPDGKFLAIGSPSATEVKTLFKGDYIEESDYNEGDIVSYQNTLWRAQEDIEGKEASIQFNSFEAVPQVLIDLNLTDSDDESVPIILTGNYPFKEVTTDHILLRAPLDMYDGTEADDIVQTVWNRFSYAYQDNTVIEATEPFDGAIPQITSNLLTGDLTIKDKIDLVLFIEEANTVPLLGQTVEVPGGYGTVAYTFVPSDISSQSSSATIYVKDVNGVFGLAGSLTTTIGEYVGEYITAAPTDASIGLDGRYGGFWLIPLPTQDTYQVPSDINYDEGRGLIYKDVITEISNDSTDRFYYNILDYDSTAVSSYNTRNSEVITLTYEGLPGPGGIISGIFPDTRYVIRAPFELTERIRTSVDPITVTMFYNNMTNYNTGEWKDLSRIGLSLDDVNITQSFTADDLWDGYIDVELTKVNPATGEYIEPEEGLIVQDVTNLGTAEIVKYQRFNTRSIRIYVKDVSGTWAQGNLFGENREIRFLADVTNPQLVYRVDRVFGQIQARSLGLEEDGIGKLIVIDTGSTISLQRPDDADVTDEYYNILDGEYWFYDFQTDIQGIPREPSIPAENNNDWLQVFNLPAAASGTATTFDRQGMFSIYQRKGVGRFVKLNSYVVPEINEWKDEAETVNLGEQLQLGSDLRFSQNGDFYRLFVKATGDGTEQSPGKVYVIKYGTENEYFYNWDLGKDKEYKGEFVNTRSYYEHDIVYIDNKLYQANTNLTPDSITGILEFNLDDWTIVEGNRSYVGYVPNNLGINVHDSSQLLDDYDSTIIDQGSLIEFAKDFDSNLNGEVLVLSTTYKNQKINKIAVYRNNNGHYELSQTINAPSNDISFGTTLAISADGRMIAVGAPLDDNRNTDDGSVFIYTQRNRQFELTQTLRSADDDRAEMFGYKVQFDGNRLAIGCKGGDANIETSFSDGTTFDRGFTKFRSFTENAGLVKIYEKVGNDLLFGHKVDFDFEDVANEESVTEFGRNVIMSNNHVYVGLPNLRYNPQYSGTVVDYRLPDYKNVWNVLRSIKAPVDVNKIKRAILYNTKTNELVTYLDYLDVLQGKIPGPADQELSYKTYYDPAIYTSGVGVNVDETNSWGEDQVGKLWWDLTNAKFINAYQGNVIYSSNNWNKQFSDINTIDVYEWVKSEYLPSEWDKLSGSEQGISQGVTGTTRYGDDAYVTKRVYDNVTKTFTSYFYYWVINKTTLPNVETRTYTARQVSDLIVDPAGSGYKFISFISDTEFALYNCENLIKDKDVALSVQYWTIDDQSINIHNQYQLVTEGLESSKPSRDIEAKWFDSLVGFDAANRPVPAPELSTKEKYGILNSPRQGWFVNRIEAVKQVISKINSVLINTLIIDDKDISRLVEKEDPPLFSSNRYDRTVDNYIDLQFVGVAKARQAVLTPTIENGKITAVTITDTGRGYLTPPTVEILGTGQNAVVTTEINNLGQITNVTIENDGENYESNTRLYVRRYTVLVNADETLNGKWALYERNVETKEWIRVVSQAYDVSLYWDYADWYETGYNTFTEIDHLIDRSYNLTNINDDIGDIIKIQNVGSGGWLLLEKINEVENSDYSVNYRTVGRQNGTIQFKDTLYDNDKSLVGFDTTTYDVLTFDSLPSTETRIILEVIRDNVFVDDLALEYNNLFFASLRYVFSEQSYVDWAFKTSFIKAKHNVGNLEQKLNFQNDNLANYEDYIKEVKPYKSKIREYLSSYENLDQSQSIVTDFDLPPRSVNGEIYPHVVKVVNNQLLEQNSDLTQYPTKHWADNSSFKVVDIKIADKGSRYTTAPVIEIVGGGGTGATAVASLGRNGVISAIKVVTKGSGYLTSPEVNIVGSYETDGSPAKAIAILGETPVRTLHTVTKFDRVSGTYEFINLQTTETFTTPGNRLSFYLKWPMDLRNSRVKVFLDDNEVLGGRYTYRNNLDTSKGYDRYLGEIEFFEPPVGDQELRVEYYKDIKMLNAQDRINLAYEPGEDQYGKTLGQLMDGVDYGGVEVRSFEFGGTAGWDSNPWFAQGWDIYDTTYEDLTFVNKEVELTFNSVVEIKQNTILVQEDTGATGRVIEDVNGTKVKLESTFNSVFDVNYPIKKYVTLRIPLGDTVTKGETVVQDFTNASGIAAEDSNGTRLIVITDITTEFSALENFEYYVDSTEDADTNPIYAASLDEYLVLPTPLEVGTEYNIYRLGYNSNNLLINNDRIDDANWDGSTVGTENNPLARMLPIIGNSEETISLIDNDIPSIPEGAESYVVLIIRKNTSDGSFLPDPDTFDTIVQGGDIAYQSATGLRAEDITIDGDGFVTQTTSKGPEEIVPGQVLDTLDIKVYERTAGGVSNITSRNYIGDGSTKTFDLNSPIVKDENLFVKVGFNIVKNYTIDYQDQSITFDLAPQAGKKVSLVSLGNSAETILDIDEYTGDGATGEFLTNVRWDINIEAFVTVDGVVTDVELFESDATYDYPDNVVIKFATPPSNNAVINIMLVSNEESNPQYSQVSIDTIIADGSTTNFDITNAPFDQKPLSYYTVVTVNDRVLSPGYSQEYVIENSQREYQLNLVQIPAASLNYYDVQVFINGRQLEYLQEFRFEGSAQFDPNLPTELQPGSTVILERGIGDNGDTVKIFVMADNDYSFGYFDVDNNFVSTPNTLYLNEPYNEDDVIKVYKFSNHNAQALERYTVEVTEQTETTPGTDRYFDFKLLQRGLIKLRSPAIDAQYVWVAVNGVLLSPSVHYSITDNRNYVKLTTEPVEGDKIQIIHFADSAVVERFAWRQFKDMLNRTHYKRLDDVYTLAEDLNWYDKSIELVDGTGLPEPEFDTRNPGVVFIEGERIEFFNRNGNTLNQIRRGTLGTGVKAVYETGSELVDQSLDSTMPYKDETEVITVTADGTTATFELPFNTDLFDLRFGRARDLIEVFVGGKRLHKNEIDVFNKDIDQDSPEGDEVYPEEFTVSGNVLTLAETPNEGIKVSVIRKIGKYWKESGQRLSDSDNDVAKFLRAKTTDLPR